MPHQNYQRTRFFLRSRSLVPPIYPSTREVCRASALVDIVPTISSRVLSFSLSLPASAMAPGNLILFGAPPKMPPSALISVHTVGCAWRLLMCYVNTLPKCRRGRNVPCVPISWTSHPSRDAGGADGTAASHEGVDRGKLMRLPAGRYQTPLSRASTARRKRESPRREVPEFKRRKCAESAVRSWPRTENGR